MSLITRKEALRAIKPRTRDVPYPELGGDVRFVEMTAAEWEDFDRDSPHYGVRLVIASAHGAEGRLYDEKDLNKLVLWPRHLIERGAKAIFVLNGILPDGDLEKNYGGAPPTDDSPPPSA